MRDRPRAAMLDSMALDLQTHRRFRDRTEAGIALGEALRDLGLEDPVILALPRGGVPVAREVARALDAPLDVLVARKIVAPGNPELAIGAIAEGGVTFVNRDVIAALGIGDTELGEAAEHAAAEVRERAQGYRRTGGPPSLAGRTAVVIDDGLATGATARAALRAAHRLGAARVVLAVPVGARESLQALRREADDIVSLKAPRALSAVGYWYDDFDQVPDRRVIELLGEAI